MERITCVQFASGAWNTSIKRLDECVEALGTLSPQYLLMHHDPFSTGKELAPDLLRLFQVPQYLLSEGTRRSNGFYDHKETFDSDGHLQAGYIWFRTLIKTANMNGKLSYKWHEMTFLCRWDAQCSVTLCIGVDVAFQNHLQQALHNIWPEVQASRNFSLLIPLAEAIVTMYDISVWSIRDIVRQAEKDRSRPTRDASHFTLLHETARHAIHSSETLNVSVETLKAMQQHASGCPDTMSSTDAIGKKSAEYSMKHLSFQLRMLQNLLLRSQSNKERLQNEIALAYNMIAQRDGQIMTGLGEAAKHDSGAMRTISVVSMAFLPPTFLSAVFSMSFFDFVPGQDGQKGQWLVSEQFWIYWAFAIPLTCLTIGIWATRKKWSRVHK